MERIVFFGTPHFVIPVLQVLEEHFQVVGVVTAPDAKVGRKQVMTPSAVKQWYLSVIARNEMTKQSQSEKIATSRQGGSRNDNIKYILTPHQFDGETIQQLHDLQPDLFVTAAYGKILPKSVLDIPQLGALNIHPSLLPKFRGSTPIQSAILAGDTTTGITIIQMDEKMDHGPIVAQEEAKITDIDTFETLSQKLFQQAAQILPTTIEQYSSNAIPLEPQDDTQATFCKELTKASGYIDLANPPSKEHLDRMIRAYYPWPGVWTTVRIMNDELRMKVLPNNKVQLEGKKPVSLQTFLRGYPEMEESMKKLEI